MGGGVEINITQEQPPSVDDVNTTTVGGEEDHQSVQYDLAAEGISMANGSCDLPEALGGLHVSDGDEDWLLSDDDVGGCDTLPLPNNAPEESVAPLPTSNTRDVSNVRLADIPLYDDGNFEEVYAKSIATPLKIMENQFRQLIWNDTPVEVHQPATDHEV
jgi:hypothetical protein